MDCVSGSMHQFVPIFNCPLQSISSVGDILNSDLFKGFLKSAVQDLKESNIVNPSRTKRQFRKSFLGKVKPDEALLAEVRLQ